VDEEGVAMADGSSATGLASRVDFAESDFDRSKAEEA